MKNFTYTVLKKVLLQQCSLGYRVDNSKQSQKIIKFKFNKNQLLKFLRLVLSLENSNLQVGGM